MDLYFAVFERLAERLKNIGGKLRKFIHEQHAPMSTGNGAGPRPRSASYQGRYAHIVVRTRKRRQMG